jgi:hypothetical protein
MYFINYFYEENGRKTVAQQTQYRMVHKIDPTEFNKNRTQVPATHCLEKLTVNALPISSWKTPLLPAVFVYILT